METTNETRKKPGPASRISQAQILDAARRYYLGDEGQSSIAKRLNVTPSYVGRLLKQARDQGLVRISIAPDPAGELAAKLLKKFPGLRHATVVMLPAEVAERDRTERPKALAVAMAPVIERMIDGEFPARSPVGAIAIGASLMCQRLVDELEIDSRQIDVGPTSLTGQAGALARLTAPTVAALLAIRLGALGRRSQAGAQASGRYFNLTVPPRDLAAAGSLFADLEKSPQWQDMVEFWRRCDLVFIGVAELDFVFKDRDPSGEIVVAARARGAVGVCASHFYDDAGSVVPMDDLLPAHSHDPAIPWEVLRSITRRESNPGAVVLDVPAWAAHVAKPLIESGICNVVVCDDLAARRLLEEPM